MAPQNKSTLLITAIEKEYDTALMTCGIDLINLFKGIISPVTSPDNYEDDVLGTPNSHQIVSYTISKYAKKNL
jgi:hypothetical protein